MNVDIERLKVDKSLWPEGANFYLAPRVGNLHNPAFFAKSWAGNQGVNMDGESCHVLFKYWHEPIPRPKPAEKVGREEWHERLLPAVRQLKHNDGSEGFVFAYDAEEALAILSTYNVTKKGE